MTTTLSPSPKQQFTDANGKPLSGGFLFTYLAGTVTKMPTYTDSTGTTPNTNPIVLDSRGECNCWLVDGTAYKFVLSPPGDTDPPTNPIWMVDNILVEGGDGGPTQQIFIYAGSHIFDPVAENEAIIAIDSPSAANLTLPQTAAKGAQGGLLQYGGGAITVVSSSGLLRNYPGVFTTIGLYATAYFYCVANADGQSAEWVLSGQLA